MPFKDDYMKFYQICGENGTIDIDVAQNVSGDIIISDSVNEISDRLFDKNKGITSVIIPGTVRCIGERAFAECENLQSVTLGEGIEIICSNAFTECSKLHQVIYPDSVTAHIGGVFRNTRLEAPVMNVSKTVLVFCPESASGRKWSVPDTVKVIFPRAFEDNKSLEVLHLPEGIEKIETMTFINCGIREITIPYSVCEIEKEAFFNCKQLEKVNVVNPRTKIANNAFYSCNNIKEINAANLKDSDKIFHLLGQPFLIQHLEDAANMNHRKSLKFKRLTALCAKGDADAMTALADWFEKRSQKKHASPFYYRAANYWRYRAYLNGNCDAAKWFSKFFSEHPNEHLESILYECNDHNEGCYTFAIPGRMMNDLGFDFFNSKRDYDIKVSEKSSIVEVGAYESSDGPDEDGFGAEDYYDWWFLDKNMQPIPGVKSVNASMRDRVIFRQFQEERSKAVAILNQRTV